LNPFDKDYGSALYSMKIKEQTRKLASGCSKHCFEVVDKSAGQKLNLRRK